MIKHCSSKVRASRGGSVGLKMVLGLVMAAVSVSACDGPQEREAKYMKRAEALLAENKLDKATLELRNVLQINPTNVRARYELGVIAERRGNWRRAYGLFTQVTNQEPKHLGANLHLARFYLIAGNLTEAQKRIDIALEQSPKSAQGKALQGAIYLRQNKLEEALSEAQAARQIDSSNLEAVSVLVGVYRKRKRYDQALAVIGAGLKKRPKERALLLLRIGLNVERNERKAVERDFSRIFEIAPDEPAFRLVLARLYILWNQPAAAELALRDAVRIKPKDENLKRLLVSFLQQRRAFPEAEKALKDLIAQNPSSRIYNFGLAGLYVQNDLSSKAKGIYRNVIEKSGNGAQIAAARVALARLLISEGDAKAARQLVDTVLKNDKNNMDALLLRGRFDYRDKKYDAVIANMREVLRQDPKSVEALGILAEAYVQTKRLDLASDALGIAASAQPKNEKVLVRLAQVYALQKQYDAALETINKVLKARPSSQQALRVKSEVLLRSERSGEARGVLDTLLNVSSDKAWVYAQMGRLHLKARDYAAALQAFDKALAEGSKDGSVVVGIASSLIAMKNYDEAIRRLNGLLEKSPKAAYLHNLLGEVYSRQQQFESARAAFKQASRLEPNWTIPYINRANVLLYEGKTKDALAVLMEASKRAPDSTMVAMSLALVYQRDGQIDQAIATYETILKQSPDLGAAKNNLAALLADYKYTEQGALDRAYALSKDFAESSQPSYLDTLGWVHYRRGEVGVAIEMLRRAVNGAPNNSEFRYHLGMAYFRNGDKEAARAELEKAVAGKASYSGLEEARAVLRQLIVEKTGVE